MCVLYYVCFNFSKRIHHQRTVPAPDLFFKYFFNASVICYTRVSQYDLKGV